LGAGCVGYKYAHGYTVIYYKKSYCALLHPIASKAD